MIKLGFDNAFAYAYSFLSGKDSGTFSFSDNTSFVLFSIGFYLFSIYLIQWKLSKHEKGFAMHYPLFKIVIILHNFFLSVSSLFLLIALLENILPNLLKHGILWTICNDEAYSQKLEVLYYVNYLLKYYELLDTVFLVLSKKNLEFLHVYHHSATLLLCYTQLVAKTSVQWVPITINLLVHVIMYFYYGRTAMGAKIWWKKYLTTFQIVQFVIDFVVIWFCILSYYIIDAFLAPRHIWFHEGINCRGNWWSAWTGAIIITSYLFLFISFFKKTYPEKSNSQAGQSDSSSNDDAISKRKIQLEKKME
jgi:fatty acid elongase 3